MTEATLTREFLDHLRRRTKCEAIKHADRFTVGVPDASVSRLGRTVWLEFKYHHGGTATLKAVLSASNRQWQLQLLTMLRLHMYAGAAYYVVWLKGRGPRLTLIVVSACKMSEMLSTDLASLAEDPRLTPAEHLARHCYCVVDGKGLAELAELIHVRTHAEGETHDARLATPISQEI